MSALARLAVVGACFAAASPAMAQANCKPRDEMVKVLSSKFKESRRSYGLSTKMQVLELFASENGTWTAVMSQPNGTSCIVASGEAWTEEVRTPPGQPL